MKREEAKSHASPIIWCNELDFGWILQESSLAEKKKMKISRRVFALLE
jgi:hypothetical protein